MAGHIIIKEEVMNFKDEVSTIIPDLRNLFENHTFSFDRNIKQVPFSTELWVIKIKIKKKNMKNMTMSTPELLSYTHHTAPTQFVEAAGIRFAYRRFGKKAGVPVVFNMHFTGTMDHWDPAVTDGLAAEREVILFNNAGISSTSGETPDSIYEMAYYEEAFIEALGLTQVDLLGISLGGLIVQQVVIDRPELIRKLVLVGTGPKGGEGMQSLTPEAQEMPKRST